MMNRDSINVKNQVIRICWNSFNLFRGLNVDDLQVVFLLISAFKDDVFKNSNQQGLGDINAFVINRCYKSDKYFLIFQTYESIIQLMASERLHEFYQFLNRLDDQELECLKSNFSEIFESLLDKYLSYASKKSGTITQPKEVTNLVIGLAKLNENAKIYNPFAGLASYAVGLKKTQFFYGQELTDYTWTLAMLRLLAHNDESKLYDSMKNNIENFNGNILFEYDDSIDSWPKNLKFDLVVATPPFVMKLTSLLKSQITGESYLDVQGYLIENGINSLNENGQLIAVLSQSFLFSSGRNDVKLKKYLVDNNLLDTIIELPLGLFSNTGIATCIIVIKTIPSKHGQVKFINASSFFDVDGARNRVLRDKELLEVVNQDAENEFLRYVSIEAIYANEFELSVRRYFLRDIQGTKLAAFSIVIGGLKVPNNKSMKQVQIRNLKEDVFDSVLISDELESSPITRGTFKLISESCLLIATRWNTLKPTYFNYTGEPIVISQAVIALALDEDIVDPTFLINEFSADYVQEQLESYRVGSVQLMLRKKDLDNIVFQLPTMQEQKAKASGIIEFSKRLRKIASEKENILSGIKAEETESSTSLSHILGKPLLSIGSSLEIIKNALTKLDPNWKTQLISQNRQFTISDAFDSILKNVKYIQELADENTSLVNISNFELTEIYFFKFLAEFIENEKKGLSNNIILKLDIHDDIKELMGNQVLIKGNPQKLRIVLVNLLDNAKNHAFNNKEQINKINVEILPFIGKEQEALNLNYDIDGRKSYVEIKVSNTGASFPKDFTLKDYIRKNFAAGKTRNRGLGGYEVNEILKAHNEGRRALNIVSNKEDSEYSSTVSFILPIL